MLSVLVFKAHVVSSQSLSCVSGMHSQMHIRGMESSVVCMCIDDDSVNYTLNGYSEIKALDMRI